MSDDAELLRRYAEERAEDAFAEFVRRHLGLVYSAALRRLGGDTHGAADVAQQVFLAAARGAGSLARHPRLSGWLYATTRNAAVNLMRGEQRRKARERAATAENAEVAGAEVAADWNHLRPLLDAAMDSLGRHDREVLLLRFFEGRSLAEVAARMRLTDNAARMRVERALDRLRTRFARRGVTSSASALALLLANEAVAAAPAGLAEGVTAGAVATAAGGAAGAATIFGLMSATKIMIGGAAVLIGVGFGVAVHEANAARASAVALTAAQGELQTARAESVVLKRQLAISEQGSTASLNHALALEKELERARQKASAVPWGNADYTRAYVAKYRASLRLTYAPLYRALHLSPDKIEGFESALADCQQAIIDVWAAAGAQGLDVGRESAANTSVARMTSDPIKERDDRLRALLGDEGLQGFRQFELPEAQAAREATNLLSTSLYASDTPLAGAQGDQLVRIIADNTKTTQVPMAADGGRPMYRMRPDTNWTAVETQARIVLSPPQLAALVSVAEQQRLAAELMDISIAGGNAGAPKQ